MRLGMKVKYRKVLGVVFAFCLCCLVSMCMAETTSDAKTKTYTVSTKSKPVDKELLAQIKKDKLYNKNTKYYYTIQSYLTKLGETGGTLKLKKGTYKIPCTLYIPSNVKIQCKAGVRLVKTSKTGTKKLKSTKFMFQLVSEGKAKKKRTVSAYKASKNVSIVGSGTVRIDMGNVSGATAIYAGHAKSVTISNIRFLNKKNSSYIWIEGSDNVTVQKCRFYNGTGGSGFQNQLAIRMESINSTTNSFSGKWSKLDNTVNKNITISQNQFISMSSCIGTVKHVASSSAARYQTGINIMGNTFKNTSKYAIYAIDWKKPSITGNKMTRTSTAVAANCFVQGMGVYNPTIKDNSIGYGNYAMYFDTAKNSGKGSSMTKNASTVSASSASAMQNNNAVANLAHYYVPVNGTRLFYFMNKSDKNFTITTATTPYREWYTDKSDYGARKVYYTFLSYMEQLEYAGGGSITVEAGTYLVTNNICIPSNVTMTLKNNVIFKKSGTTAATEINGKSVYAKSIFTLIPPSLDGTSRTVKGYEGAHDIKIVGEGSAQIDCSNVTNCMGLVMGHARNITIRQVTFLNQYGSHFMELNSSNNVVVEDCRFEGFKPLNQVSYKECINVDGTDENTNGFNYDWSTHDKTTCKDVFIRRNIFRNIGTAVGSHTFSANEDAKTQLYHENVQVIDNMVERTYNAAVHALNWKNCVIRGNTFKDLQALKDGKTMANGNQTPYVAVFLCGVVNPTVTENVFDTMEYYPIRVILSFAANTNGAKAAEYPDTVCSISEKNWEDMQNNTWKNIATKYLWIIVREDQDATDANSKENDMSIDLDPNTPEDPVDPDEPGVAVTSSAARVVR